MKHNELIAEYLSQGFNCAQVVTVSFAEKLNADKKTLLATAAGFGGGIGRQGLTCGAVSGGVIVLGLTKGQIEPFDTDSKQATYQAVQEFSSRFKQKNGAIACKDLLNCDISTHEGFELHKQGCHKEICFRCIETAIEILDEMLK